MATPINLASLTQSQQVLRSLQANFGTMQLGNYQAVRRQFYSYIPYGSGSTQLNFFGSALGNTGQNSQLTNLPTAGSFGTSSFLVKQIRCKYYVNGSVSTATWGTTHTDAASGLYADMVNGFFQAGVLQFVVNAKTFVTINKPFLNAPASDGRTELTATGTYSTTAGQFPYADLSRRSENSYMVDPEIFIAAQQNFSLSIVYPSGVIAPICTNPAFATTSIGYVGVSLDGIEFRPVQ
jgi:hypothetical protein